MSKNKRIDRTLTEDQVRAYQEGKLAGKEAYEVERTAFDSDFDSDALEGLSQESSTTWTRDLTDLRARLLGKNKKNPYLRVAAVISILLVASVSVWLVVERREDTLAYQEPLEKEKSAEESFEVPEEIVAPIEEKPKLEQPVAAVKKADAIVSKEKVQKPAVEPEPEIELEQGGLDSESNQTVAIEPEAPEEVNEEALSEVVVVPMESITFSDEHEDDNLGQGNEATEQSIPAPAALSEVSRSKSEKKDVRSKLAATGAVSRAASAPSSAEIVTCSTEDGYYGKSFTCATPEGGMGKLSEYLADKATSEAISSMVELTIDESGSLENIRIDKSTNSDFDAFVIQLLKEGPKWLPGTLNGDPVKSNLLLIISLSN